MNNRFPKKREFKARFCFECGKKLNFGDFLLRNRKSSRERLLPLWESDNIELYCCLCYDNIIEKTKLEGIIENLEEFECDCIKILEKKFSIKIPVLKSLRYDSIGYTISQNHISGLSLFNLGLMNYPEIINHLKFLKYLNLSWNSIKIIPDSIKKLTNLEIFDLIGNGLDIIPSSIENLRKLKYLDLSFNKLKHVPKSLGKMESLKTLKLIRNIIKDIPRSLKLREELDLDLLI